jgi:hypothetical protein
MMNPSTLYDVYRDTFYSVAYFSSLIGYLGYFRGDLALILVDIGGQLEFRYIDKHGDVVFSWYPSYLYS